jgi:hypothetical protein
MQVTTTCTLQPPARVPSTREPSVHRHLQSRFLEHWRACVTGLVTFVVAGGGLTTLLINRFACVVALLDQLSKTSAVTRLTLSEPWSSGRLVPGVH